MKIKINTEEVNELSKYIVSKSEEIKSIYGDIEKEIENVSSAWVGNDSKEFAKAAREDIKNEMNKTGIIKKFGEELACVSKDFKDQESSWVEHIKRENVNNE